MVFLSKGLDDFTLGILKGLYSGGVEITYCDKNVPMVTVKIPIYNGE